MSKPIQKVTVRCPHCRAEQQEPGMAKSTFCRKCSEYFAITPAVLGGMSPAAAPAPPPKKVGPFGSAAPRETPSVRSPAGPASAPPPDHRAGPGGFRGKLEGLLGGKPRTRTANCFECASWHEVSSSAQSTTCKACGAYIDLQDYKITGSFSRNIKTRGTLFLGPKGDLSSSKVVCEQATIHGRMRGNLTCPGRVTIRVQGRLYGSVEAGQLIVEKGAEVVFSRPIHASSVEVHGTMSGQVVSDSLVTIFKSGSLDGAVEATGFTVEKGGCFQGELTITPRGSVAPAAAPGESTGSGEDARANAEAGGDLDADLLGGAPRPALG